MNSNYIDLNRQAWNEKTKFHLDSDFYDVNSFLQGKSSLNDVELGLLGDIRGKSILHLQCHFGMDTISLSRLGAQVTGMDLADQAIEKARVLAKELNTDTTFICCDLYELPQVLNQKFDLVFASYGTIGWLPDLDRWAQVIRHFLKPGGQFVFVEFHPVIWMFDYQFERIAYNYFNDGPIAETESGTYADREAPIAHTTISWNHSLSEVLNSLIKHDLTIQSFDEYDYSPYDCFQHTVQVADNKFRIRHLDDKIPMVYAIKAIRKS